MAEFSDLELTNKPVPVPWIRMIKDEHYKAVLYELACAGVPLKEVVNQVRRDYIAAAMYIENGKGLRAAARIGVHRNTLARRAGKDEEEC